MKFPKPSATTLKKIGTKIGIALTLIAIIFFITGSVSCSAISGILSGIIFSTAVLVKD